MKQSRIIAVLLALLFVFPACAFAVSRDEARQIAAQYVPEDCALTDVDREGFSFEVKFDRPSAQEEYKVTLKSISGTVVKVEREYEGRRSEGRAQYTPEDAVAKVKELYPESVTPISFMGVDDKAEILQVLFAAEDRWGLFEMGPASGTVFAVDLYFEGAERVAQEQYLPFERIRDAVLAIKGGEFDEIKLEYDDGRLLYVGEVDTGLFSDAEFEADPVTGRIVEWDD